MALMVGAGWRKPFSPTRSFRDTFAAMRVALGSNVMQLSRLLGHHSAAFSLQAYGHIMDADVGGPMDFELEGGNGVATEATGNGPNEPEWAAADSAQ